MTILILAMDRGYSLFIHETYSPWDELTQFFSTTNNIWILISVSMISLRDETVSIGSYYVIITGHVTSSVISCFSSQFEMRNGCQISRFKESKFPISMPLFVVVVHLSSGDGSIDVVVIPRQWCHNVTYMLFTAFVLTFQKMSFPLRWRARAIVFDMAYQYDWSNRAVGLNTIFCAFCFILFSTLTQTVLLCQLQWREMLSKLLGALSCMILVDILPNDAMNPKMMIVLSY